ncbi:hypothetical protein ASG84_08710 [Rhodococcus sp. Leaf278]|uniref:GGDEF domain-containing protein n=1 Tax=Rhodococcus sp. Leaf278 TaxID=1736319 RepID=UPI00070C9487|nr:GGDEF domain-containing protein [Rhodococcus sp. Leaf278]KQU47184.1 hypothetical protein ASG84_08710 [Rhodococcus sp. Leaf278]
MADRYLPSEGSVSRAVDQLPSMISNWNTDLVNIFANKAHAEFFDIEPSEIPGMHIREVLGEALYEWTRPYIAAALNGEPQQFDSVIVDLRGTERVVQANYVPDRIDGKIIGFTAMIVDVSRRAEAERQRDRAIRLFEIAMEHAPIGKAILMLDGRLIRVNNALCELLGYTAEELQQKTFREITHPDDVALADEHLAGVAAGKLGSISTEKRYIRKDGATIWVQRNAALVRDEDAGDVIIAQIQDITARKAAEFALERQLLVDDLTSLGNRRRLMAELEGLEGAPVGVLFVDVDAFKSINDRFGHVIGDQVLQALGQRILNNIRADDVACRIGGDEFVILLRSARSLEGVERLAGRVVELLAGPYDIDGTEVPMTVSIGWSWEPSAAPEKLLKKADERMYSSKRA